MLFYFIYTTHLYIFIPYICIINQLLPLSAPDASALYAALSLVYVNILQTIKAPHETPSKSAMTIPKIRPKAEPKLFLSSF